MLKNQLWILLLGVLMIAAVTPVSAEEETPALLFKNARVLGKEGKEQNLRTAVYLLEKMRHESIFLYGFIVFNDLIQ